MTSPGHKLLHKHCLQSKASTNNHPLTIGPAHCRSVSLTFNHAERKCHVALKSKINYNHCHYLVYTGYSIQMCVHFLTVHAFESVVNRTNVDKWKNVRFDAFGLNSSFASLYRYQKDPRARNKWIVYFKGIPDRIRGLFREFCFLNEAQCHGKCQNEGWIFFLHIFHIKKTFSTYLFICFLGQMY